MTNRPIIDHATIIEIINNGLDLIIGYTEFIASQTPNESNTNAISDARILRNKISNSSGRFLTVKETETLRDRLIPMILYWNKSIGKQVVSYYNAQAKMANLQTSPTLLRDYNPIRFLLENREKFYGVEHVFSEIIAKTKDRLIDEIDLYATFYWIVLSVETTEKNLHQSFIEDLKKFHLESEFDSNEIFFVTVKKRNKLGNYQTDSKMIRNSLAHRF